MTRARDEDGYALVAAVASIAVFAALGLSLAMAARMRVISTSADIVQAKAGLAAESGIMIAVHGLMRRDPRAAVALDGRVRTISVDGATVRIAIADESGFVPLNRLDEGRATRLLQVAGLDGQALAVARDSLLDWIDDDDETRPDGAEMSYYAPFGIIPANGALSSVEELARIRGFTSAIVERLKPFVTVDPNARLFDATHADPRAIGVMDERAEGGPQAIERARELAGQHTALSFDTPGGLIGRPLVITADATLPDRGHARRRVVVELTRSTARPYLISDYR